MSADQGKLTPATLNAAMEALGSNVRAIGRGPEAPRYRYLTAAYVDWLGIDVVPLRSVRSSRGYAVRHPDDVLPRADSLCWRDSVVLDGHRYLRDPRHGPGFVLENALCHHLEDRHQAILRDWGVTVSTEVGIDTAGNPELAGLKTLVASSPAQREVHAARIDMQRDLARQILAGPHDVVAAPPRQGRGRALRNAARARVLAARSRLARWIDPWDSDPDW